MAGPGAGNKIMKETNSGHGPHHAAKGALPPGAYRPYWRRAHRDWRIWACGVIMLGALFIYSTNYELPWWPRNHPVTAPPLDR